MKPLEAYATEALFDAPAPRQMSSGRHTAYEGQSITVALVSCGKSKQAVPAPARDLYTGDLFTKGKAYAELVADRWYVLSAKHRLVHPDKVLEPYDMQMSDRRLEDRIHWGFSVDCSLRTSDATLDGPGMQPGLDRDLIGLGTWSMGGGHVKVILLAGVDYREHLVPKLLNWGCEVEVPMEGLTFGQQKRWLGQQTDATAVPVAVRL